MQRVTADCLAMAYLIAISLLLFFAAICAILCRARTTDEAGGFRVLIVSVSCVLWLIAAAVLTYLLKDALLCLSF